MNILSRFRNNQVDQEEVRTCDPRRSSGGTRAARLQKKCKKMMCRGHVFELYRRSHGQDVGCEKRGCCSLVEARVQINNRARHPSSQ